MRKLLTLLLSLALLGGCAAKPPAAPQSPLAGRSGNYETTANIVYRGLEATASIAQSTPESCRVAFSAPDTVEGMELTFARDSVGVAYKGLSFQFDPGSVPSGAVARIAVEAIGKAMRDEGVELRQTESGLELCGALDAGEFTLRLDAESGNLLKLSVPSEDLEITFENFRFLD